MMDVLPLHGFRVDFAVESNDSLLGKYRSVVVHALALKLARFKNRIKSNEKLAGEKEMLAREKEKPALMQRLFEKVAAYEE